MPSFLLSAVAAFALLGATQAQNSSSLPIVDLGYELHQASAFNQTGRYYNFSNIRYAAPPVGELRFAAPQAPAVNRSQVQTGNVDRICPQANGAWISTAIQFIPRYLSGETIFNETSFVSASTSSNGSTVAAPAPDARISEDCLFLDVMVPEAIYNARDSGYGAPVLVWIYGGGYAVGSKTSSGNPAGLLERSKSSTGNGVIFVAMNYRLGAFGWLSGPSFQKNGTANAGLYDQRLALEWVQQNIHLFGGDPNRVTVFGESAGGGSIMHQITAFGGHKGPAPFAQAVPQSPGFSLKVSAIQQEATYNNFLSLLNVTSIQAARQLPSSALIRANAIQVGGSPYGSYTYGPTVDGDFVPALPGQLLAHGQYDKSIRVMVGHNAREGLLFTPPFIQNDTDFEAFILRQYPNLIGSPSILNYITQTLYPPIFDGSQAMNYTDQIGRAAALVSESIFTCNTLYLDRAYNNQTYSYFFTVPPALHGQDVMHSFYNGPANASAPASLVGGQLLSPAVAIAMQEYITHFAETGNPNEQGVPWFNMFGNNSTVQVLNITGIRQAVDPTANYRCDWWQSGLAY